VVRLRHWPLVLLVLGFLALATLYNFSVPFGEGPDEPGHLRYVLFLAREGRLPVQRAHPAPSDVPGEGHQPPLAYLTMLPAVAWLPPDVQLVQTANPQFLWAGGNDPAAFMRGSWELARTHEMALAWHLARAVSALWAALAIVGTYFAARELHTTSAALPLFAAALVAFNPQFLFSSALVTNDTALAAFGALILWRCAALLNRHPDPAHAPLPHLIGLGLLFGLALITKQSALLFGPALLWVGWRVATTWTQAIWFTLAWGGPALLLSGWWFGRNWWLYGDLFGLELFSAEFAGQAFVWTSLAAWEAALRQLFASFWGRFGWMSLPLPTWMLFGYAILCGVALLGVLGRSRSIHPRWRWQLPLLLIGMALVWTFAFALTAGLVAWQGRMLFPAISALALALAAGWAAFRLRWLLVLWSALLLGGAVFAPLQVIRPAYPWTALAPAVAQATLGMPTYGRFAEPWERGVALHGWRIDGAARAGAALPITLTWHSLERIPHQWSVFIHLAADATSDELLVVRNSVPRDGTLPMPLWTPGDWITDAHTLDLPPDLPPGSYTLRVGLYRADGDGRRAAVWDAADSLIGDYLVLGTLVVE
jgi:hypothetical protein